MGQGSCSRSHAGKLSGQRLVTRSLDSIPCEQGNNKRSKATLDVGSTARLAQSVVRKALNLVLVGSSPTVGILRTRPQLSIHSDVAAIMKLAGVA